MMDDKMDIVCSRNPPHRLPLDILHLILAYALPDDLCRYRFVSRDLESIATPLLFRHVRLEALIGGNNARFMNVAMSPKLRQFVREVTCDTDLGKDYRYRANYDYITPYDFMKHLPCLRFLSNLKSLNLRFNEHCDVSDRELEGIGADENQDFRYRVLDTVFQCLAGTWSAERQYGLDEDLDIRLDIEPDMYDLPDDDVAVGPIHIESLVVANIANFSEPRLTDSESFRYVVQSGHLRQLKLLIAEEVDESSPWETFRFPEQYEMLDELPQTWLSAQVIQNVQWLSLCNTGYWGWLPKMDVRSLSPTGPPLPNLKVLVLGNYIFSHEWQVDWIASIGSQNQLGGLQELYLNDCPIMVDARCPAPLDQGYPVKENLTDYTDDSIVKKYKFQLRWHKILERWQEKMTALKLFKIGHDEDYYDNFVILAGTGIREDQRMKPPEYTLAYIRFGIEWEDCNWRKESGWTDEDYDEEDEKEAVAHLGTVELDQAALFSFKETIQDRNRSAINDSA